MMLRLHLALFISAFWVLSPTLAEVESSQPDFEILDLSPQEILEIDQAGLKAYLQKEKQKGVLGRIRAFTLGKAPLDVFASYQLIDDAIEGGVPLGEPSLWEEIAAKLNLYRVGLNANRAYNIYGRDARVGKFLTGLLATKLLTHGLETTAIFWLNALAASNNASPSTYALATSGALVMSLPLEFISYYMYRKFGLPINPLEPICAIGGIVYIYSRTARSLIRIFTLGAQYSVLPMGQAIIWAMFRDLDRLSYIAEVAKSGKRGKFRYGPDIQSDANRIQMTFRSDPSKPVLDLFFVRSNQAQWELDTLRMAIKSRNELEELLRDPALKALNLGVRDLVREAIQAYLDGHLESYKERFYVSEILLNESRAEVKVYRGAARLTPRKQLRIFRRPCALDQVAQQTAR